MEGIEKIAQKITDDAQAELDALFAQTDEKTRAVADDAQAKADKEREDILARGRRAADERLTRLNSAARMETRKLTLAAKQEVVSEAFDQALEHLCALPDGEYTALLTRLARKACATGREQLVFNQKDRARVGKQVVVAVNDALGKQLTLSEQTRPIKGGFIMLDGDIEVNCAFETLVRLAREKLEKDVAQALFEA